MEGGGYKVFTPRQAEANKTYEEMKDADRQKKLEQRRNREFSFYFASSKDRCGTVKPQTIARLFFLATFISYDDNTLRHSSGVPLKKSELPKLMGLGNTAFKEFWSDIHDKYIFAGNDGTLSVSHDFFMGRVLARNMERCDENGYQKIFIKPIRALYHQTPVEKHRYLGYLFLILPCINWEYNVLCWNPDEQNRDDIEIMTLDEFCDLIGYNNRKRTRLLDAYKQLSFKWRGQEQPVCAYLTNKMNGKNYFVLNPNIIYKGSDRRKVDGFGVFFNSKVYKRFTDNGLTDNRKTELP